MKRRPVLTVILIAATSLTVMARAATAEAEKRPPAGSIAWLATGDSYSSGEGIAGTGTGADTCAQSKLAYGPEAAEILHAQRSWTIGPLAFTACTGALTGGFYNATGGVHQPLWAWSQAQTSASRRFDVITMSFGGNDIGFANILSNCLALPDRWTAAMDTADGCKVTAAGVRARIDQLINGYSAAKPTSRFGVNNSHETLAQFYAEVADSHLTDRGELVVAGYPRLFAPSSSWAPWLGGRCNMMSASDADMLGRAAEYFDGELRNAVQKANTIAHHKIVYISRLDLFDQPPSHTLCNGRTEWLNGLSVGFWDGTLRYEHSFHPNELGHQATAEEIAGQLDRDLSRPDPTPTTSSAPTVATEAPPPITSAGGHFDIGDSFDSKCIVAWPTAPTRTTDQIDMTMSCTGVPQQFTLVEVAYGDPNLPITPSTGQVHVHGQITDIAQDGFGFRDLVVVADHVDLP